MTNIDPEFLFKVLRFGVVGTSGTVIDFGLTWLLKEKAKINKFAANSVGFTIAATSNFLLNRIWTFQSGHPDVAGQFFKFMVIAVMGLALSNLIIWLLHSRYKLNFYLVKLMSVGVVMVWNFSMNYLYTFATA